MTLSSRGEEDSAAVKDLFPEIAASLALLQRIQQLYDTEMWEVESPAFAKLRHIQLHLSVAVGKISAALEKLDHLAYRDETPTDLTDLHVTLQPVLADLVIYSLQFANVGASDLGELLKRRYQQNAKRFAPASQFADL